MKNSMIDQQQHFVLYTSADGNILVDVVLQDENVWLTQKAMGLLFGVESHTITYHLKEIFRSGELDEKATTRKIRAVQNEGKRQVTRNLDFYNLDAIISVGYRVNSYQATQFRIWATKTLKEYIIKGFVMDDERLKQGKRFGKDYFEELLERIREIRASERRFYQKITDIYALSTDYDKNAPISKDFFATVQNKLHWAITGKTAAEIIYDSADVKEDAIKQIQRLNSPELIANNEAFHRMPNRRHQSKLPQRRALAERMKDTEDELELVIVRDMWLTGFDVPSLHTMYIDKPMKGHTLMQVIARVNRVYKDKSGGLVVDYLGIASDLIEALSFYSDSGGKGDPAYLQEQAVQLMLEKLEIVSQMFCGFSYEHYFVADTSTKSHKK